MRPSDAKLLMQNRYVLRLWVEAISHFVVQAAADASSSVTQRQQKVADAAASAQHWRVTVRTPIQDLDLTVRAYNTLARAGLTTVGEILRSKEKPSQGPLDSLEQFDAALQEIKNRLVAGLIDEAKLPSWLESA